MSERDNRVVAVAVEDGMPQPDGTHSVRAKMVDSNGPPIGLKELPPDPPQIDVGVARAMLAESARSALLYEYRQPDDQFLASLAMMFLAGRVSVPFNQALAADERCDGAVAEAVALARRVYAAAREATSSASPR